MEVVSYNSYAGFTVRFFAFILDRLIISFLFTLIWIGTIGMSALTDQGYLGFGFLSSELLIMAYFVISETSGWQATLGKKVFGKKVVTTGFQKMSVGTAILRYLSKYLSAFVFMLGFIWVIFDSRKQGWHDKIAGTYVISE